MWVKNCLPICFPNLNKILHNSKFDAITAMAPLQGVAKLVQIYFFVLCIVLKKCFALSRSVSEYLQHENMDLVSAVSGVQSLKDSLSSFRNEEKMDQFLQDARKYCTDQGLVVHDPNRPKRRRTIPSYFNNGTFFLD